MPAAYVPADQLKRRVPPLGRPGPGSGRPGESPGQDASFVQAKRRIDAAAAGGRLPVAAVIAEDQDAATVGVPIRQGRLDPDDVP